MSWDEIGGAAAGAAGGLVRWHQDPQRVETLARKITAAVTSVVCGGGFGYLTQAVVEWKLPDIPHSVAVGLAFVAGLTSGVLSQVAVTVVSEVIGRLKYKLLDRMLPLPEPHNGPAPPAGAAAGQSAGGGNPHGGTRGSDGGAVAGVHLHSRGSADGATPPAAGTQPQG